MELLQLGGEGGEEAAAAAELAAYSRFSGHAGTVSCVRASGDMVFTGCFDSACRAYDVKTLEERRVFCGHYGPVYCLYVWSVNKELNLFSGSRDKTVRMWDVPSAHCTKVFEGHNDHVTCMQIWDGVLYTGSRDQTARSWNIDTGEEVFTFRGHAGAIFCLRCLHGALYTGAYDRRVISWDITTGEHLSVFEGHSGPVVSLGVWRNCLYSAGHDKTVRVWNTKTGRQTRLFRAHRNFVNCLTVADGYLYSGSRDGTARGWDVRSLAVDLTSKTAEEDLFRMYGAAAFDMIAEKSKKSRFRSPSVAFVGHTMPVMCIRVWRGILFTGSNDKTVRAWDRKSGKCLRVYREHTDAVRCLAVCETMLITGGNDKVAQQSSALSTLLDCTTKEQTEYGVKVAAGAVLAMLRAPHPSFPESTFHCRKLDYQAVSSLVRIASFVEPKRIAAHERAKSLVTGVLRKLGDMMRDELDEVVIDEDEQLLAQKHQEKMASMSTVVLERLAQVPQPPQPLRHPLETLKLRELSLSVLPVVCLEPRYLTDLDASHNKLTTLPPEIGKCDKLRSLNVGSNRLTTLPSTVRRLSKLKFLNVSNNRLGEFPAEISGCGELQSLQLSQNSVRVMPPTLHYLTALKMLDISSNALEALPVEIGGCTALTSLNLSGNGPKNNGIAGQLVQLMQGGKGNESDSQTVQEAGGGATPQPQADRKCLTELPQQLGLLPYLTNLQLNGLKLRRPEGIEQAQAEGPKAVIRFLRDSLHTMRQRFAGRLVLVGHPGSGKSALWLAMESYENRRRELERKRRSWHGHVPFVKQRGLSEFRHLVPHTTRGIEIHQTHWDGVELLLWDMAGEPAYGMLQQHFIHQSSNDACIYVVVWDVTVGLKAGKQQIRSQLGELSSIVAQPYIFLIGTHADKLLPKRKRRQPKQQSNLGRRNSTEIFCEEEDADDNEWAKVKDELDGLLNEMKSVVHRTEVGVTARVLEATTFAMCDRSDTFAPTGRAHFIDGFQRLRQTMEPIFCSKGQDDEDDELVAWIRSGSTNWRNSVQSSSSGAPKAVMCTELAQLDESGANLPSSNGERKPSVGNTRSQLFAEALHSRRTSDESDSPAEQNRMRWLEDMSQTLWALAHRLVAATFRSEGNAAALLVDGTLRELLQPCESQGVASGESGVVFARLKPGSEAWTSKVKSSGGWYHGGEVVSLRTGHGLGDLQGSLLNALRQQRSFGSFQPATYAMLQELVLLNRRRYSPPVLTWDQFAAEFGVLSGMGGEKLWAAALQLHKWGILHFDPMVGAFGNVIVLDPQWLGTAMFCLVSHCIEQRGAGIDLEVLRHIWGARNDAHVFPARLHMWLMRLMEHYQLCYLVRHASKQDIKLVKAPVPSRRLSLKQVARRVSLSVAMGRAKSQAKSEEPQAALGLAESDMWGAADDVQDLAKKQAEQKRQQEEKQAREQFEFAEGLTQEEAKQEQLALRKQMNTQSGTKEYQIAVPSSSADFRLVWKRTGDVKQEQHEAQRAEDREQRQKLISQSEKKGRSAIARERRLWLVKLMGRLIPGPVRLVVRAGVMNCSRKRKPIEDDYSDYSDEEEMEGVLSLAQQEIEEEEEKAEAERETESKRSETAQDGNARRMSLSGIGMVTSAIGKFRKNRTHRNSQTDSSPDAARRLSVAMFMHHGSAKGKKDRRRARGRNSIEELTFLAGRTNCYIVAALLPEGLCVEPSLPEETNNKAKQPRKTTASITAAAGGASIYGGRRRSAGDFFRSLARKQRKSSAAVVTPVALQSDEARQTPGGQPSKEAEEKAKSAVAKMFGGKRASASATAPGAGTAPAPRVSAWKAVRRASRASFSLLKGLKSSRSSKDAPQDLPKTQVEQADRPEETAPSTQQPTKVEEWTGCWESIKEYELHGRINPSFFSRLLSQLQGFNEDGSMRCWRSLAGLKVDEHNVLIRMHNNPRHHTFRNNTSPIFATNDTPAPQKRAKRRWSLLAQNADRVVLKENASTAKSDKQRPGQRPVLEIRVRGQLPATVLLALDLTIDKLLRWHWGIHFSAVVRPLTKVYRSQMAQTTETWVVSINTLQPVLERPQRYALEWVKGQIRMDGLDARVIGETSSGTEQDCMSLIELVTGVPKAEAERTSAGHELLAALHAAELSFDECILQFVVTLATWYQSKTNAKFDSNATEYELDPAVALRHVSKMLHRQLRRIALMDEQWPSSIRYGRAVELNVQLVHRGDASTAGPLQPLPWLFCVLPTDPSRPQEWADPLHWHNDTVRLFMLSDSIVTGFRLTHDHPGYALEAPMQAVKHLLPLIKIILVAVHALATLRHRAEARMKGSNDANSAFPSSKGGGPRGLASMFKNRGAPPPVSSPSSNEQDDEFKQGLRRCIEKLPRSQRGVKTLLDTPYECFAFLEIMVSKFEEHERHHAAKQKARELKRIQQGLSPTKSHRKRPSAGSVSEAAAWMRTQFSALDEADKIAARAGLVQITKENGEVVWVSPSKVADEGVVWGQRAWEMVRLAGERQARGADGV